MVAFSFASLIVTVPSGLLRRRKVLTGHRRAKLRIHDYYWQDWEWLLCVVLCCVVL